MRASLIALVAVLLLSTTPVVAQQATTSIYTAYADESLTVDSTAGGVGFDATKLAQPVGQFGRFVGMVSFRVVCASSTPCAINVLYDGNAPTSSTGFPLNENDIGTIYGQGNIQKFRAIRSGSNNAVLRVTYHYF